MDTDTDNFIDKKVKHNYASQLWSLYLHASNRTFLFHKFRLIINSLT